MWAESDNAAFAGIERDLVVFVVDQDRYVALPDSLTCGSADAPPVDRLAPAARDALIAAGLLVTGKAAACPLAVCCEVLEESKVAPALRARDWISFAHANAVAWRLLKRGIASRNYSRTRRALPARYGDLALEMARIRRMLTWLPVTHRCLPRTLSTALYLRRRGHDVDIVFGVRSHPFDAHCWLEQGGRLLNDELGYVSAYTPIIVGRP